MEEEKIKAISEHICNWLDAHPGFSFNWLCRQLKVDGANMQRCRQKRIFPEKHIAKMEEILGKVKGYVPLQQTALMPEAMEVFGSRVIEVAEMKVLREEPKEVDGRVLHPDQDKYPERFIDESLIDYKIRIAKNKNDCKQ